MPAARAAEGLPIRAGLPPIRIEPRSGGLNARENFDERRFAGAVGTHQRHDLAGRDGERDSVEHQIAAETLADGLGDNGRGRHRRRIAGLER